SVERITVWPRAVWYWKSRRASRACCSVSNRLSRLRISNIQVARKQCLMKFLEAIRAIRQKVKDPDQIEPRVVPGARLRDLPARDGGRDSGNQLMLSRNQGRAGFCQCIPAEFGFLAL